MEGMWELEAALHAERGLVPFEDEANMQRKAEPRDFPEKWKPVHGFISYLQLWNESLQT